jgi:hypothetical protein
VKRPKASCFNVHQAKLSTLDFGYTRIATIESVLSRSLSRVSEIMHRTPPFFTLAGHGDKLRYLPYLCLRYSSIRGRRTEFVVLVQVPISFIHCRRCPPCHFIPSVIPSMMIFFKESCRTTCPKYRIFLVLTVLSIFASQPARSNTSRLDTLSP